jgi:hypothetical protein
MNLPKASGQKSAWAPAAVLGVAALAGGLGAGFMFTDPTHMPFFPGAGAAMALVGSLAALGLGIGARRLLAQSEEDETAKEADSDTDR